MYDLSGDYSTITPTFNLNRLTEQILDLQLKLDKAVAYTTNNDGYTSRLVSRKVLINEV